jgi:RNA polymerase sigma-70 factor (ECF subfamily)
MTQAVNRVRWLDSISPTEWLRLVHLCTSLTHCSEAAEDLAQDTLYEACRNAHKLDDPANRSRWLAAIAHNVCLRWRRQWGQVQARHMGGDNAGAVDELPAVETDIEHGLERAELAALLDRALVFLPPATRAVLVERYVRESPLAEIAARLDLSEAVVAKRLERGKLHLRRILTTDLAHEALLYDLLPTDAAIGWQETHVWCSRCGRFRLLIRHAQPPGTISVRCQGCNPSPEMNDADYALTNSHFARLIGALAQPRAILRRTAQWAHTYFRHAIDEGSAPCTHCGRPARVHITSTVDHAQLRDSMPRLVVSCAACDQVVSSSVGGLVASLPEVQRFWQEQRRMSTRFRREANVASGGAVVAHVESIASAAWMDVLVACDTLQVIGIHSNHPVTSGR